MPSDITKIAFAHPLLAAAGPQTRDAAGVRRLRDGGAAGVVMQTVTTRTARTPRPFLAAHGTDALLSSCLWSELPVEQYIATEYSAAAEAGVPVIASLGFTTEELVELGPRIEATGVVAALEFPLYFTGMGYEPVIAAARALRAAVRLPLWAKLSPAMPEVGALARAIEPSVDAFTVGGAMPTGLALDVTARNATLGSKLGTGWLSGRPLQAIALRCVLDVARQVSTPVIGCGGIMSGRDVVAFLQAGARAVQIGTAAILEGPGVFARIHEELDEWLYAHGHETVESIHGVYLEAARRGRKLDTVGAVPQVADAHCVRCGSCVAACFVQAPALEYDGDEQHLVIDAEKCIRCGLCVTVCPHGALSTG